MAQTTLSRLVRLRMLASSASSSSSRSSPAIASILPRARSANFSTADDVSPIFRGYSLSLCLGLFESAMALTVVNLRFCQECLIVLDKPEELILLCRT